CRECGGTGGLCRLVLTTLLADRMDVGRADGGGRGCRRTEPRRRPCRSGRGGCACGGALRARRRDVHWILLPPLPATTARHLRHGRARRRRDRRPAPARAECLRSFG